MLIYDLSVRSLVTESGIPDTRKPSLVFGDRPTWDIRVMDAGQPADLSGITGWTAAIAEDLNPGTRPMCRTTSGISENEGVVSVPLDTQTDTFAGAFSRDEIELKAALICKCAIGPFAVAFSRDEIELKAALICKCAIGPFAVAFSRDEIELKAALICKTPFLWVSCIKAGLPFSVEHCLSTGLRSRPCEG